MMELTAKPAKTINVIPAQAGVQDFYTTSLIQYWIPAFAGMTILNKLCALCGLKRSKT
jgi:hypothetical protein